MADRLYLQQNPWLTFTYRSELNALWASLGEAYSKCRHLAGIPLQPSLAANLGSVYMRRGALSTTAIEGNTLSAEELDQIIDDGKRLPPSQEYLEQEVRNVLDALTEIDQAAKRGEFRLSAQWIRDQNARVLRDLEVPEHVVPGEYSQVQTGVGAYRSAPPEDIPYLVDQLCEWLNRDFLAAVTAPGTPDDQRFFCAFLAATLGHLYVAWIHPFGDGNGRTARLLQVAILANSGVVPWVSTNLLSDFYNRTRGRYYQRLERASKADDVAGFILYSAQGFVDLLREQIGVVQKAQRRVAWINYVHEVMHDEPSGKAKDRRRDLVLALHEEPVQRKELTRLTPELAAAYANTERMLTRDLHRLQELGLVRPVLKGKWIANIEIIDAFKC